MEMSFGGQVLRKDNVRIIQFQVCLYAKYKTKIFFGI